VNDAFWFEKWREGKLGFHEGKPNAMLERHVARLGTNRRVLVPLCGKTEDLAFLASHGHRVLGIELVEDAVRAFFTEHQLVPAIERTGELAVYSAGAITIIAGNLFAVDPAIAGPLDALYDRAAMIAVPDRARYVAHVKSLVAPRSPAIVVTLEYPPELMTGPPFSVGEAELRSYYADAELLEQLADPRRERAIEKCWACASSS
jgi:thiopurine S-methyltransferase